MRWTFILKRCHRRVKAKTQQQWISDEQKKTIRLRREVQYLYFESDYSKNQIVRLLNVSKGFVVNWTQSNQQDSERDERGWPKGRGRVWADTVRSRIRCLHRWLNTQPKQFYTGATAIQQLYR